MTWPRWFYAWRARIVAILGSGRADDALQDEVSFHLAMQTRENLQRGMTPQDAARWARIALGGADQTKELVREERPLYMFATLMQDVRYALRIIRRTPGFSAVAVITIALGIGANTAIFSVVNGILLRPLPYADPDRLVRLNLVNPAQDIADGPLSVPDVDDWRSRTRSFSSIAGYSTFPIIHTGQGDPTELQAAFVVGDFFGTLGTRARIGRTLGEDDVRQAVPNVVISERLWRTRFGAADSVLGTVLTLGARPYTVVGVMPSDFRYPAAVTEVWAPHSVLSDQDVGPRVRNQRVLEVVGRLAPGVTVEQAHDDANATAAQLASDFPATNKGWTAARVVPLRTTIVGQVDTALLVVLAVVGVILLIACANLANLFFARGTARAHEMATRVALGAGRLRIVRQLLTESLVLGIVGGILGLALSYWGVQALVGLSAETLPRVENVRIDGRVIGYGLLLAFGTALMFGILPALRAAHADPKQRMRTDRGAVGGGGRLRSTLVVAEVGLAVVLVIGAGLMARSFLHLRSVDPGFDPDRVVAVALRFNVAGATGDIGAHLVRRREEIVERLRALPGVVDAGSIRTLPLEGGCGDILIFIKADGTAAPDGSPLRVANCLVSPGYLSTMKIPLVRGEPLPDRHISGAPIPFVINEAAARRFWPGEDPIGQVLRANYGGRAVIVGIVGDVRQHGLAEDPPPVAYFNQRISPRMATTVVLRTAVDPMTLAGPIREAIRELDPNQPIRSIVTLGEVMSESIARDRFFTLLFGLFGALALVLAGVGIYGVLAYSVGQRTREIGVRMAVGASAGNVLGMVLREGMLLVLTGVAAGGLASLAVMRVLRSQLHGVSATDPLTFVVAPAILAAVALVACYVPAWRATHIEPVTALRAE